MNEQNKIDLFRNLVCGNDRDMNVKYESYKKRQMNKSFVLQIKTYLYVCNKIYQ